MSNGLDRRSLLKLAAALPLGWQASSVAGSAPTGQGASDRSGRPSASTRSVPAEWTSYLADAANSGALPAARPTTEPVYERWTRVLSEEPRTRGNPNGHVDVTPATISHGRAFFGVRGDVVGVSLVDGDVKWRVSVAGEPTFQPAVAGDTVVVATNRRDAGPPTPGPVYGLSASSGESVWEPKTAFEAGRIGTSGTVRTGHRAPVIVDDTAYVLTDQWDGNARAEGGRTHLTAIDLATGAFVWSGLDRGWPFGYTVPKTRGFVQTGVSGSAARDVWTTKAPAVDPSGRLAFVGIGVDDEGQMETKIRNGFVEAVRVDGTRPQQAWREWITDRSRWYRLHAGPTYADGKVIVVGETKQDGNKRAAVVAMEATSGRRDWLTTFDEPLQRAPVRDSDSPAVAHGRVYLTTDRRLRVLGLGDGGRVWSFEFPEPDVSWAPQTARGPTVAGQVVYAVSPWGELYALDATAGSATVRWRNKPGTRVGFDPPTAVGDRLVFHGISAGDDEGAVPGGGGGGGGGESNPLLPPTPAPETTTGTGGGGGTTTTDAGGETDLPDGPAEVVFSYWNGGLDVSTPNEVTELSGLQGDITVSVQNDTERRVENVEVEAELLGVHDNGEFPHLSSFKATDGGTLEQGGSLDPDEQGSIELTFEVSHLAQGEYVVRFVVQSDDTKPIRDAALVNVEKTIEVGMDVPRSALPLEVGEEWTEFTYAVSCTDERGMDGVEIVPRFSAVPGDWELKQFQKGLNRGDAQDSAGGRWRIAPNQDDRLWAIDHLDADASAAPSERVSVPEGAMTGTKAEGSVTITLDAYAESPRSGQRTIVNTVSLDVQLVEKRLKLRAFGPPKNVDAGETLDVETVLGAEDDPVEDIVVTLEVPDGFDPLPGDSTVDRGSFRVLSGGDLQYTLQNLAPGDAVFPKFVMTAPATEDFENVNVKRSYSVGVAASGGYGGTSPATAHDTAEVRLDRLAVLGDTKQELASRITASTSDAVDDQAVYDETVPPILSNESDGTLDRDVALDAMRRLLGSESLVNREIEVVTDAPERGKPRYGHTDYNLARTMVAGGVSFITASRFIGGGLRLAGKYLPKLVGKAKPVVRIASGFVTHAADRFVEVVEGLISLAIITLGKRGNQLKADLLDQNASDVEDAMDELASGNTVITGLTKLVVTRWEKEYVAKQLDAIRTGLDYSVVEGGLPGNPRAARIAHKEGIAGMNATTDFLTGVVSTLEEGVLDNARDVVQNLKDLVSAIDQGNGLDAIWELVSTLFDVGNTVLNFLFGGLVAALGGAVALASVSGIGSLGIGLIIAGDDVNFGRRTERRLGSGGGSSAGGGET